MVVQSAVREGTEAVVNSGGVPDAVSMTMFTARGGGEGGERRTGTPTGAMSRACTTTVEGPPLFSFMRAHITTTLRRFRCNEETNHQKLDERGWGQRWVSINLVATNRRGLTACQSDILISGHPQLTFYCGPV